VSLRVVRPKPQSLTATSHRLCRPAERPQRIAEAVVSLRVIGPKPQSLVGTRRSLCWPTEGRQRHAKGEMNLGMGGLDGQNLAIRYLSLQKSSGLMVNEGLLKQIHDSRT
jgi:hypothetical protein